MAHKKSGDDARQDQNNGGDAAPAELTSVSRRSLLAGAAAAGSFAASGMSLGSAGEAFAGNDKDDRDSGRDKRCKGSSTDIGS